MSSEDKLSIKVKSEQKKGLWPRMKTWGTNVKDRFKDRFGKKTLKDDNPEALSENPVILPVERGMASREDSHSFTGVAPQGTTKPANFDEWKIPGVHPEHSTEKPVGQ